MNVLVTGGTGFIGSHVCDALLRRGHNIRVLSRKAEPYRPPLPGVDYFLGDIADTFYLSEALSGMDAVIHLVSSTVPGTSNLDPVADINFNLAGTVRMLELMRQAGPKRIVFLSSGGTVYGEPSRLPVAETEPLNPLCSYGVTKVAIEHYLGMYAFLYGIEPVVLRASNPFGPRQGRLGIQGLVAAFLSRILAGKPLVVWGDGEVIRDYFYASDLADLCALAVESTETGIFNAGSGQGTSINRMIELIGKATAIQPEVHYEPQRKFDVRETYLDISKARTAFGWEPVVDLESGISQHWDWLRSLS
ncbi:MAG: NAD-dependent epimerase/dehydratase family protein [Halioglobus sp.]|nr:NAD-dependent epimerase/dehydratase family protein [Halioglobus sp.]